MSYRFPTKHPGDKLPYTIDYDKILETGDDTSSVVTSVSPSADADDLIVDSNDCTGSRNVVLVLDKGVAEQLYTITVTMTSDDGYIVKRDFKIKVKEL